MSDQSGAALVLALAALVVVALAVMVVAADLDGRQVSIRHEHRDAVLESLADAAFAEALAKLSVDRGFDGSGPRPFGEGTIASSVVAVGPSSRHVVARAELEGWVAVIDSEVDVTTGPRVLRVRRLVRPAVAAGEASR